MWLKQIYNTILSPSQMQIVKIIYNIVNKFNRYIYTLNFAFTCVHWSLNLNLFKYVIYTSIYVYIITYLLLYNRYNK